MPASPEWANLPKRWCGDCGKRYKPYRPLKENEVGFCSANCRKSYHKHGGAYRKLRDLVRKMVEQEFAEMRGEQQQIRAELAKLQALIVRPANDRWTEPIPTGPHPQQAPTQATRRPRP